MKTFRRALTVMFALFLLSAAGHLIRAQDQQVTLDVKDGRLSKVLHEIENQTGLAFFYNNAEVDGSRRISCSCSSQPVKDVLARILPGFSFSFENRRVLISGNVPDRAEIPSPPSSSPTFPVLTGTVKDDLGQVLPGASVIVSGASGKAGTLADSEGRFHLALPFKFSGNERISFSFMGFRTLSRRLGSATDFNVILRKEVESLPEAIAIGYGAVRESDITGAVVNVDMGDVRNVAAFTLDKALQGRITGADILSIDGEPGSMSSIRIRGTRSITASNEPLIVVDGIMDAIHDLNDINPEDIASVSILKDASSTAIYGSRGANGVIIITTHKGASMDREEITFHTSFGAAGLPRKLDIMDASEFAAYWNDVANFGADPEHPKVGDGNVVVYEHPETLGKGTDWMEAITRRAWIQDYALSASGRSDKSSHYTSFSYNDTQGIIQASGLRRFTGRIMVERQLFKWLHASYSGTYVWRHNDVNKAPIGGAAYYNGATYLSPLMKPEDDRNPLCDFIGKINTPKALVDQNTHFIERHSTSHSFTVNLTPMANLAIKSIFSHYLYQRHTYRYFPGTLPAKAADEGGQAYRGEYNEGSLSSETVADYAIRTAKHSFSLLGGISAYRFASKFLDLSGAGYMDDAVMWNNMGGVLSKQTYSASSSKLEKTKMSYFVRMNGNIGERYCLTATARLDQASNFALDKKSAFFPSLAFRWNLDAEPFMKQLRHVDVLALRASIGRTGNDAIGSYQSISMLGSTTEGYLFDNKQPVAVFRNRLDSPDLSWEKTTSLNVGMDVSFFGHRVAATVELYGSETRDLLLNVQVPTQTGYSYVFRNLGATANRGVELAVKTRNVSGKDFGWASSFTLSRNRQIVKDIGTEDLVSVFDSPGNNPYMMYGYVKGYPLNALWGFKNGGTWKNQEEVERNRITRTYVSLSTQDGAQRYYDINHDGILSAEDLIYQGNADPYLYGGLANDFRLGNFSFGVYFTYSLGGKIYNYSEFYMAGSKITNQYRYMAGAWHPERNPESDIPRAASKSDAALASDFMIHDASFLRLKNAYLSYTLSSGRRKSFFREVIFTLTGENMWLWKKYNGFDPDVSSYGTSSTLRRVDLGAYPKARTVMIGVRLKY